LVRRETAPDAGGNGGSAEVGPGGDTGPLAAARRTVDDAEQRSDRKLEPQLEPGLELFPAPRIHPDLAAPAALAATHERFVDAEPGAPEDHDQAAQPTPVRTVAGRAHDG